MPHDVITDIAGLEAIYGEFPDGARRKESAVLTPLVQRWISASPFALLATVSEEGLDCSPRGDPAPVAHVVDEHTLHLPDRLGNNRLDTLRNIVLDPRIGLLFLVPGLDVTLRVNGTAALRTDDELRAQYTVRDKAPATVIEVNVQTVYAQCPKALLRSELWNPAKMRSREELPTMGQLLAEAFRANDAELDAEEFDTTHPQRITQSIY